MNEHRIEFVPLCKEGSCRNVESILDSAQRMGIGLASLCGGAGKCKTCKIRIIEGTVSEMLSRHGGTERSGAKIGLWNHYGVFF